MWPTALEKGSSRSFGCMPKVPAVTAANAMIGAPSAP